MLFPLCISQYVSVLNMTLKRALKHHSFIHAFVPKLHMVAHFSYVGIFQQNTPPDCHMTVQQGQILSVHVLGKLNLKT